jgi:hypothetical protein
MLFMGYVNALVVEKCLMEKLPENLFSQRIIRGLKSEVLSLIAGENENTAKERKKCEEELNWLKECLEKLGYCSDED